MVVTFTLQVQALADNIESYSHKKEYPADNGYFPENAVLHPVLGESGTLLIVLFFDYTGRKLHD